ncbi:MAG TPA: hypothetical protein VJ303_15925 [Steroidobacteraceae bacterium]|jgi:photosystem II stability/assembly factor-like uncharacterized protein|nr:hypothetical protein [Steroidobacteraceae bacterium]
MLRLWNLRKPALTWVVSVGALCSAATASAADNAFSLIGPEGGSILQVQFHPTNAAIAYALTSGGYYRSTDGGLNWTLVGQNLNLQFTPLDLAIDPSNPNRVLVAVPGQTPLVSDDAGATLAHSATFPFAPADVRHIEFSADGSVAYAASGVRIVRSTDHGVTWTEKAPVSANAQSSLQFLRVDPLDPDVVYAVDLNEGGFRSTDGGDSWRPLGLPANSFDMAITSTTPQQIWVASLNTGLHRSTDGGATWPVAFPGGPAPAAVMTIALDPQNQSVVYASLAQAGVFRTADGNGWANVTTDTPMGLVNSIAVNPVDSTHVMLGSSTGIVEGVPSTVGIGGTWERRNHGIFAASANDISFAGSSGRVYVSTFDTGVHFLADGDAVTTPVDNDALQGLQSSSTLASTFGLLAQSRGSDRVFVGISGGYARSDDNGDTWQLGTATGTNGNVDTVVHFAASPDNPDLIVASTAPGMHRSIDGGDTWVPANAGLPAQAEATALAFAGVGAPNTVFAGIEVFGGGAQGVYKSTDGGVNWTPANSGFETSEIRAVAVDPHEPQVVYVAAGANGLLKTTNGGASWSRLDWPNPPGLTTAVAIDPNLPSTIYVAGLNTFARSVDDGAMWEVLRSADARPEWHVNALLADPRRSSTLLAATHTHGLAEITIAPDVELTPGVMPVSPVAPGTQSTYRYRLRNLGAFHATDVETVVTLPADATAISATTTTGMCQVQGTIVTCIVPTLAAAAEVEFAVSATHPAVGDFEVVASVDSDQPDPVSANNEVRTAVTIQEIVNPGPGNGGGGGGGGGGGSDSLLWLLALCVLRIGQLRGRTLRLT